MARTYSYNDALTIAMAALGPAVGRVAEDTLAVTACNLALDKIWKHGDWRETLVELPPFWLYPAEQDYGKPTYAVPTDFLGLREAYVVNIQGTYREQWPLDVQTNLQQTQTRDLPTKICYREAIQGFRVWPRTPESIGAPAWYVTGTYKKRPTKVSIDSLNTTLPFDDLYFHTFVETLKWAMLQLAGSPRAGEVRTDGRGSVTTGQLAVAESMIFEMANNEGLNLGDGAISPREPLATQLLT